MKEAVLRVVKEGVRYYLYRLEIDWSRQTCCVVARSDEWLLTASKARFALLKLVEETRGMNPLVNDCLRVFDERGAVTKEDALYALVAMSEDEYLEWNVPNLLGEFLEKRERQQIHKRRHNMSTLKADIEALRKEMSKIDRIDPDGPLYKKIIELLNKTNDEGLLLIKDANIPFVSALALNRCIRRGLV